MFDNIVINSVKMYFKNFIVNIFFSALMFILPYVIYLLIRGEAFSPLASFAVFAVAFFSVCLVYVPFVVSMHKARITQLWKSLLRKTLILSVIFAAISAALYFALCIFILHNAENTAIAVIAFAFILFFAWQLTVLKAVNIVCNATDENGTGISLRTVIFSYKSAFAVAFLFGVIAVVAIPASWEAVKLANLAKYPYLEEPSENPQSAPILSADQTAVRNIFLLLPIFAISLYETYVISIMRMNDCENGTDE